MADRKYKSIKKKLNEGSFTDVAERYIERCCEKGKFPNMAGFCRFCHIGQSELEEFGKKYPLQYDLLCSFFVDEALNSRIAAAVINPYMKRYLGYGDGKKSGDEPVTVCFEHDIMKDGK